MREFSEFEKKVLRIFVELQNKNELSRENVVYRLYEGEVRNMKAVEHGITVEYSSLDDTFRDNFERTLSSLDFLYKYLDKECLIGSSGSFVNSNMPKNTDEGNKSFLYIYTWWMHRQILTNGLQISQALVEHIKRDFITIEREQFELQLDEAKGQTNEAKDQSRYARLTLGLSIAAIAISIILPIAISKCSSTKLDEQQLDNLQQSIESTKPLQNINARITNDTLKVEVINKQLKVKKIN